MSLSLTWAMLIAFAVLAYVVLDGFDLGTGILFAVHRNRADRDIMVNSIAPVWDGNETWLVFGGGGLFAVFPLAYAVIMPALYPVIIGMLLALIFRGVAFEFRFRASRLAGRVGWDVAFFTGSLTAVFCQGLALGALLQGIKVQNGAYAGGWWDWLSPFSVVCGVATVVGYSLLGACWLIWRTEGELQRQSRQHAGQLGAATLIMIVTVSVWTPFLTGDYSARWFSWPNLLVVWPIPLLVAVLAVRFWRGLLREEQLMPLVCALGWFVLSFVGLGISMYPHIVPPDITLYQAAAPPESQRFLLVGSAVLVPAILTYTGYAYWVFRGKVSAHTSYH